MNITSTSTQKEDILSYDFELLDTSLFKNVLDKDILKSLDKWGITPNMELVKYRYNMNLNLVDLEAFLRDFFSNCIVRSSLPCLQGISFSDSNKLRKVENIKYKKLTCNSTNTDIFDILYENHVVNQENGYIKHNFDEYVEDIHMSDDLKQSLLREESEYYTIYPEEMRNEFLFHVFQRVVIGGSLCQYEDYIQDYFKVTKALYKDLVSAAKDPQTEEIYIRSTAIQIFEVEKSNLFKIPNHPQNFFYLTIDPYQRHVNVWYHKWVPYW